MAWIVSPCLLTLLGFYFGTIFGNREHKVDLQVSDIHNGAQLAAVFLVASVIIAMIVTVVIPPVVERDYETREAKWAERAEHGSEHAEHH